MLREAIAFYSEASFVFRSGLYRDEEQTPPEQRAALGPALTGRTSLARSEGAGSPALPMLRQLSWLSAAALFIWFGFHVSGLDAAITRLVLRSGCGRIPAQGCLAVQHVVGHDAPEVD